MGRHDSSLCLHPAPTPRVQTLGKQRLPGCPLPSTSVSVNVCVCVCVWCWRTARGVRRTAHGPRPTAHSARPTAHGAWSTAGARENRRRMSLWQIGSQTTESGAGEQFLLKGGKAVSRVRGIVLFKPVPAARPLLLRQRQDRPQRWYGHFSCWNCFCP